jgi:hypothetical protein
MKQIQFIQDKSVIIFGILFLALLNIPVLGADYHVYSNEDISNANSAVSAGDIVHIYFYDGWSIPGETGDVIYTSARQSATITGVNYSTGQITVGTSIFWAQGDGVTVVDYSGLAPDIGAFEYTVSTDTGEPALREDLGMGVYPNPSNKKAITVSYELPVVSDVIIHVMNETGSIIQAFETKKQGKGLHLLEIDTVDYKPGLWH